MRAKWRPRTVEHTTKSLRNSDGGRLCIVHVGEKVGLIPPRWHQQSSISIVGTDTQATIRVDPSHIQAGAITYEREMKGLTRLSKFFQHRSSVYLYIALSSLSRDWNWVSNIRVLERGYVFSR